MEQATEIFAAVLFAVIGLSHIAQPRAWVDFFITLRAKGYAGAFVNGFLSLSLGALIVSFHNVWEGLPMILTLVGWAQVVKGIVNLVVPRVALWGFARVSHERAWQFVAGGILALALSAVFFFIGLTH